jgi:hypothetical protein
VEVRQRGHACGAIAIALLCAFACAWTPGAWAAGIHAGLTPADSTVQPNAEFTIDFSIITPDAAFNGFDAVVEYDPAMLTFLPTVPASQQQGPLMLGACGNTFHLFAAAGDSITFTSVLLCAGQSLTGPGRLYRLRFQAGATTGVTSVRLRATRTQFYNAGLFVFPVETADARVQIGDLTDAGPAGPPPGLSLRALPNPSRSGAITLRLSSDRSGPQRVTIRDARSRLVRAFEVSDAPAGERTLAWDGRDGSGRRVPAGWYAVLFRAGGREVHDRVVLVP